MPLTLLAPPPLPPLPPLRFKPGQLRKSNRKGGAVDLLCFLTPPPESPRAGPPSSSHPPSSGTLLPMQLMVVSVRGSLRCNL